MQRHDRDRYQTVLFAPVARREALFALYAFNYEIARVRERVTQPTLARLKAYLDPGSSAVKALQLLADQSAFLDPPENESACPATFTTTVEPAGAVMLIVAPE